MVLYKQLCDLLGRENVLKDELMSRHTTFRIGGPADYFVIPQNTEQIRAVVTQCKKEKIPYYVLGNGSNLLVGDKGYRGVIIQIYRNYSEIKVEAERIYAQAGALLSKIAAEALSNSLTGVEFASGIPGTLGGAVMMNAGAYGGEMKQVIESAEILTKDGDVKTLTVEELELAYRTSSIAKTEGIVLSAILHLEQGDTESVRSYMEELKEKRVTKQPLEYASAGSTFKRPEGYFAGKLIDDAGLRGFCLGNAQVSEKHCGFVINRGKATALDVISLMQQVSEKVEASSGVKLEPEVKRIGEF